MKAENNLPFIIGREQAYWKQAIVLLLVFAALTLPFEWPVETVKMIWKLSTEGLCPKLATIEPCTYLYQDVLASGKRVLPSLLIAPVAVAVALLGSLFTIFGLLLRWSAIFGIAIPSTAVFILLLHLLGFGESSKVVGMMTVGFTTQLLFSVYAVRDFLYGTGTNAMQWEPIYRQLQLDGVGRFRLMWEHMIPLLAPKFFYGLIMVAGIAWKMTIIFEFIGSSTQGLGYLMYLGINLGGAEGRALLLAGLVMVLILSGLTVGLVYLLSRLNERRLLHFPFEQYMPRP